MSAAAFTIRPMVSGDVERVMEIAAQLKDAPHWPRSAYLSALDIQAQPRRLALVATDRLSDNPLAYAVANLVLPGAELEAIGVVAAMHRHGIGRALLVYFMKRLKQEHVKEMWLEVRISNAPAIAFYRSAGFAEAGRRKSYYADPIEDATVMKLTMD